MPVRSLRTNSIWVVALLMVLASCNHHSVYEKAVQLPESGWSIDSLVTFTVQVPEDGNYTMYYLLKNQTTYPFSNLYLKYDLRDEQNTIGNGLQEIVLFHPVTGKPFGRGLGGVMEHKLYAFQNKPLKKGSHVLTLQHYMRQPVIEGVLAIGIRLDKSVE